MIQARKRNKSTLGGTYYYPYNDNVIEFLQIGVTGYFIDISVNLDIEGRAILYKEDKKLSTKYYDYATNSWQDTVVTLPCYTLLSNGILKNAYTTGVDGSKRVPNDNEVPYLYHSVTVNNEEVVTVKETDSLDGKYVNVRVSGAYSDSFYRFPSGKWSEDDERKYKSSYLKSSFVSSSIGSASIVSEGSSIVISSSISADGFSSITVS